MYNCACNEPKTVINCNFLKKKLTNRKKDCCALVPIKSIPVTITHITALSKSCMARGDDGFIVCFGNLNTDVTINVIINYRDETSIAFIDITNLILLVDKFVIKYSVQTLLR